MSTLAIAPDERVQIKLISYCRTCDIRHNNQAVSPNEFNSQAFDWLCKHEGHDIEFLSPSRLLPRGLDESRYHRLADDQVPWWLTAGENADAKPTLEALGTLTLRLDSDSGLATSSTFTAGRISTDVNLTLTPGYLDYRIWGKTKFQANAAVASSIRVYCLSSMDDSEGYPGIFGSSYTGTDGEFSVSDAALLDCMGFLGSQSCYAATTFPVNQLQTLATVFGFVPKDWAIFVAHNSGSTTTTTQADHVWNYRGMKVTIA